MIDIKTVTGGSALLDSRQVLNKAGIAQGKKVADFGCGTAGHFVIPAAHLVGKEGVAYAVDILKSALEGVSSRAKLEGLTNVETVWSDLEVYGATKIPDKSLDIGLIINNLFQSQKKEEFLREAARMIKPEGNLLIVDWKMTQIPSFGPPVEFRVPAEEVKKLAVKLGLQLTEEFAAGKFHFALVFKKK
ncbi:MAG: methyltransferase domain-containing protein [Patescibacteria group bacterium]|nr:methyltransferase domain-containing protein [Patescibacteria group bacterium]MDD5490788.1 methyltransferase domain-containing protein [Patescibacteria group bacterium]